MVSRRAGIRVSSATITPRPESAEPKTFSAGVLNLKFAPIRGPARCELQIHHTSDRKRHSLYFHGNNVHYLPVMLCEGVFSAAT
jgi:hypothetical protein